MALNYDNIITLRDVFGKVGQKNYIQPAKDPRTGRYPDCIRRVDSKGDVVLSEKDKEEGKIVIPEDTVFEIEDGTTFNLDDPYQAAQWEAIRHSKLIADSRLAKDSKGNPIIDGEIVGNTKNYAKLMSARYGAAVLYVERPGEETDKKVKKVKIKTQANMFILEDSLEGLLIKAKLLGRDMKNQHPSDVMDFLVDYAERDPQRIINLYTGEDLHLRLLLIDARKNGVIRTKNKLYIFGDDVILGASEEAAITWMKDPRNFKVLELIKKETYKEAYEIKNADALKLSKSKKEADILNLNPIKEETKSDDEVTAELVNLDKDAEEGGEDNLVTPPEDIFSEDEPVKPKKGPFGRPAK